MTDWIDWSRLKAVRAQMLGEADEATVARRVEEWRRRLLRKEPSWEAQLDEELVDLLYRIQTAG